MSELLDAAGRRRSPVTLPEFHAGRPPRNKGIPRHRQHRDHRHRPRPPRADGPRRQLAPALTPRPAAVSRALPAAGPRRNHRPRTGVASDSRMLHSSPSSDCRRPKRPAPTARRSTHAASRRTTPGRRTRNFVRIDAAAVHACHFHEKLRPCGIDRDFRKARITRTTRCSWRTCGTSSKRRSPPGTSPADP
jgi:hypothetical protein